MKYLGFLLIVVGLALFAFVIYSFFQTKNRLISPIPEGQGVKVIFVTPTQ